MSNTTPNTNPRDYQEAFDQFALSYEDPSRPEPSLSDFDDSFEDPSNDEPSQDTSPEDVEPQESQTTPSREETKPQVTEAPLNYKELYEKSQKDLRDQAGLYASRFESLTKQYHEVKGQLKDKEDKAKVEPEKMPANVQELFEVHPELADAVQTLIDTKVRAATESVRTSIKEDIEPIQKHLATTESQNHLARIESAHPDLRAIIDSGDLNKWIESLPMVARTGASYVYQFGNADEIISLLNDYKADRNSKTTSGSVNTSQAKAPSETVNTEDIVKQVMAAMNVRSNKEPISIESKRKAPREKSFDELAIEYEKTRRIR